MNFLLPIYNCGSAIQLERSARQFSSAVQLGSSAWQFSLAVQLGISSRQHSSIAQIGNSALQLSFCTFFFVRSARPFRLKVFSVLFSIWPLRGSFLGSGGTFSAFLTNERTARPFLGKKAIKSSSLGGQMRIYIRWVKRGFLPSVFRGHQSSEIEGGVQAKILGQNDMTGSLIYMNKAFGAQKEFSLYD